MIIIKSITCILLLFILPILIGSSVFDFLKLEKSIFKCLVIGMMTMWAFCQIVSIPIIFFKQSFLFVVIILSLIYLSILIYGFVKKSYTYLYQWILSLGKKVLSHNNRTLSACNVFGILLALGSLAIVIFLFISLQHTDADDSRFGVNIVDILRTHRMFITDPGTGEIIGHWYGEVVRDVISPWAVFIAYCSYLLRIHPTIMFHFIVPIFIYLCVYSVYWNLSRQLIGDEVIYRGLFICFMTVLNTYGYASVYTSETFLMIRLWQGKSIVTGLGIPLLISIYLSIYKRGVDKRIIVVLLLVEIALAHLSGMGILIGALMAGCYGLVYGILKKSWREALGIWVTAVPCFIFYGLSIFV